MSGSFSSVRPGTQALCSTTAERRLRSFRLNGVHEEMLRRRRLGSLRGRGLRLLSGRSVVGDCGVERADPATRREGRAAPERPAVRAPTPPDHRARAPWAGDRPVRRHATSARSRPSGRYAAAFDRPVVLTREASDAVDRPRLHRLGNQVTRAAAALEQPCQRRDEIAQDCVVVPIVGAAYEQQDQAPAGLANDLRIEIQSLIGNLKDIARREQGG